MIKSVQKIPKGCEKKKKNIKQGTMQELLTGKKRLEGFKDSWTTEYLPTVCWFQEGPGLRNWQFKTKGMKIINITNFVNGYLDLEKTQRHISIDEFDKMYKHFKIDEKDIVIASSGNSYGKVAVVRKKDLPLMMNTSVIRFKPLNNLDYNFLLQFLKSSNFKNQIDFLITGGAQPNFGPIHLDQIKIKLPPTKNEQVVIGEILYDMDTLIINFETLIEKKKNIKQGTIQELLTGKRRLDGFTDDWKIKKLGVCLTKKPEYGINAPAVKYSYNLPTYIRITDISENGEFVHKNKVSVNQNNTDQFILEKGDIVFARTGASTGKTYLYDTKDGKLVFAGFLIKIKTDPTILLPEYLKQFTETSAYWNW
ncbi:restriction endonuclease subunit S, partial [Nitrosopumilus sp.]|nr:restriction endonuclease subunit S [Nitrosopumilus sp.]